jgi:hypothetical protein
MKVRRQVNYGTVSFEGFYSRYQAPLAIEEISHAAWETSREAKFTTDQCNIHAVELLSIGQIRG